jgi:hypothetical protein
MLGKIDPTPLFRALSRVPLPYLGTGYALCVALSVLWPEWSWDLDIPSTAWFGRLLPVLAFSITLLVVALYRDDDTFPAAVALSVITAVGVWAGTALVTIVKTASVGPAILMAAMSPVLILRLLFLVARL